MKRIHSISIHFLPAREMRYPTLGDWQFVGDDAHTNLMITVQQMPNQMMSWPLVVHELVEALLCTAKGITPETVDAWDISGPGRNLPDPGGDPRAPYHAEHCLAEEHEYKLVVELGLTAKEYNHYLQQEEDWAAPSGKPLPSITCPRCGFTSYHPKDIEEGYCGRCHDWTGVPSAREDDQ